MINPNAPRSGFLFADSEEPWSTKQLTDALTRETTKRIGFRLTTQEYRHVSIAIDRKFIRGHDAEPDAEDEDEDDVHDLMAAHSTKLATARYARMGGLTRSLTPESISIFRTISDKWQRWFRLQARRSIPVEMVDVPTQPLPIVSTKDKMQSVLYRLYGPTGTFKSQEQEQAVEAVANGVSPLFIIQPTGAGKSVSFMIPAMFPEAKSTAVVTPLVALAEDMLRRCKDAGIDCIIYGRVAPRMARIIIVVTESAASSSFAQFMLDIHLKGRLDRIVFDEIHKLVMDSNFRPKLEELNKLVLPVQYVFLTATFPPSLIERFNDSMLIQDATFIRQVNHKPRVRYNVERLSAQGYYSEAAGMVQQVVESCNEMEKVLVFCRSRPECDKWAEKFGCGVYYSDSVNKAGTLQEWRSGLLFATGALGAGVDVSGIKAVVHVGRPYGMINFDQEVGRGGRAGEIVTSVVLVADDDYIQMLAEEPETLASDERAMREFMITNGCRREGLSMYMNGENARVDCKSLGGELCDKCKYELTNAESGKRRREADEKEVRELKRKKGLGERERLLRLSQMEKGERMVRATERHRWLQGKCAVCWLIEGYVEHEHLTRLCPMLERMVGQKYKDFRARYLGYANNTTCYKCGLPGDLCDSYSNKRRCEDADVVLPLAIAAYLKIELGMRDMIKEVAGKEFVDVISYGGWLVQKGRWLGENGSNAFGIFERIVGSKGEVDSN